MLARLPVPFAAELSRLDSSPPKLRRGDKVAVLSPSLAAPALFPAPHGANNIQNQRTDRPGPGGIRKDADPGCRQAVKAVISSRVRNNPEAKFRQQVE